MNQIDESFNTETIFAIDEYYEMKSNPEKYIRYSNIKEAIKAVLNET